VRSTNLPPPLPVAEGGGGVDEHSVDGKIEGGRVNGLPVLEF
jgi:hypothetical protein